MPALRPVAERLRQWLASFAGAVSCLGLFQLAAPWLGFSLRVGLPVLLVALVLGLPGMLLLLGLHLMFFTL